MNTRKVLIVDDEPLTRKSLYEILRHKRFTVFSAAGGEEALEIVRKERPEVVITDLKMPRMTGIDLLKSVKEINREIEVVLITGYGSIETAVEAMKEGAFDYITKPILDDEINFVLNRIFEKRKILEENKFLKECIDRNRRTRFHSIIGQNVQMQRIYSLIETVAPTNASVLIQGESGTGKRLVAQAIHASCPVRKDKPFIEVSCGALPETLLESELFGHVKGAFTSAIRDRQGRFEAADGGTIFLDEIDAFSPKLQVKLLRVLQEGEFERVGDTRTRKVDVRVVAATNQNIMQLIKDGLFREDLYYRLNVIPIYVPPLRERKDDLPLLVGHFLEKCSRKVRKNITEISDDAMELLSRYDWPGNVRELENVIERAVILCQGRKITRENLPESLVKEGGTQGEGVKILPLKEYTSLKEALRISEREIIINTLKVCAGNRKKAAQALGINRTTLYNKMREYGLLREDNN